MSNQFADLGVSRAVVHALDERGFTEPFAIQKLVIGDVLAGRDVLAKSPTGSGKTLAFAVPLSDRIAAEDQRPACLVLAPTRELASQIVDEWRSIAHARALRVTAVYGGVSLSKQSREAARSHIIVAMLSVCAVALGSPSVSVAAVAILFVSDRPWFNNAMGPVKVRLVESLAALLNVYPKLSVIGLAMTRVPPPIGCRALLDVLLNSNVPVPNGPAVIDG